MCTANMLRIEPPSPTNQKRTKGTSGPIIQRIEDDEDALELRIEHPNQRRIMKVTSGLPIQKIEDKEVLELRIDHPKQQRRTKSTTCQKIQIIADDVDEEEALERVCRPPPPSSLVAGFGWRLEPSATFVPHVNSQVLRPKPLRPTEVPTTTNMGSSSDTAAAAAGHLFYQEAEELQLPHGALHKAVRDSHEWHQKWTTTSTQTQSPRRKNKFSSAPTAEKKKKSTIDYILAMDSNMLRKPQQQPNNSAAAPAPRRLKRKAAAPVIAKPIPIRIRRPPNPVVKLPAVLVTTSDDMVPVHLIEDLPPFCREGGNNDSCPLSGRNSVSPLTIGDEADQEDRSWHLQTIPTSRPWMIEDNDEDDEEEEYRHIQAPRENALKASLQRARDHLLHALAVSQGDTDSAGFQSALGVLVEYYELSGLVQKSHRCNRVDGHSEEGMWLSLTKPTYFDCLGDNGKGDPMYTLGRMSFDMFFPGNLVCSIQGNFNEVKRVLTAKTAPKPLQAEVQRRTSILRTYDVITAFTIEPIAPADATEAPNVDINRPIRGLMTTFGYILEDPDTPERNTVWITGGRIEPNDSAADVIEWKRLFAEHPPQHSVSEQARRLAVKWYLGATLPGEMSESGAMEYSFTRPFGGHGTTFVDTLFVDESLRIVRGHRGTNYVFTRVPDR